jgi:hypothetical protein
MEGAYLAFLAMGLLTRMAVADPAASVASLPVSSFKAVPPMVLDREGLAHETPHLPNAHESDIAGAYMLFVDRKGQVVRVDVVESIAGGDDAVMATLRRWTFKPQPVPIRSLVRLVFSGTRSPGIPVGIPGRHRMLSQEQAAREALSAPQPQLPDGVRRKLAGHPVEGRYVIFVAASGKVEYVQVEQSIAGADESIIAVVGTWKYSPAPVGMRFVQRFVFDSPR